MPTSNETRVRVDGFWKIIPSVRPGRSSCGSRLLPELLELVGEVEHSLQLLGVQLPMRVKSRPFRCCATSTIRGAECYALS